MHEVDARDFEVECSGIVTKLGTKITSFSVADKVFGISTSHSTYSSYTRIKAAFAFKVNSCLSFEDAASIPVALCTAHYDLLDLARLENDEAVMIHGGAGAASQAAIALALVSGAGVFVTVGSREEKDVLMKSYQLTSDHVSPGHHASFGPAIRHATGDRGVDVVLNRLRSIQRASDGS